MCSSSDIRDGGLSLEKEGLCFARVVVAAVAAAAARAVTRYGPRNAPDTESVLILHGALPTPATGVTHSPDRAVQAHPKVDERRCRRASAIAAWDYALRQEFGG